eukprot:TRINITY_DN2838_c2_g1_i1.p1 TRINITY_DN2838_c2_g1~~TRINITY_DN2838_c2_g1_i1.p1  ORF type:complete len:1193 (+),score=367.52 TRINITY_DN2838_c2_g1_i1:369-3947(+)
MPAWAYRHAEEEAVMSASGNRLLAVLPLRASAEEVDGGDHDSGSDGRRDEAARCPSAPDSVHPQATPAESRCGLARSDAVRSRVRGTPGDPGIDLHRFNSGSSWRIGKLLDASRSWHKDDLDDVSSEDEDHVDSDDVVQAKVLIYYLTLDIKRWHACRGFPIFLLHLVFFSMGSGYTYLSTRDQAMLYMTDSVSQNIMLTEQFRSVSTPADFYQWLALVTSNLWEFGAGNDTREAYQRYMDDRRATALRSGTAAGGGGSFNSVLVSAKAGGYYAARQNVPLHWLLVRLHRLNNGACGDVGPQADPISPHIHALFERECYGEYDSANLNGTRFRENATHPYTPHLDNASDPFTADADKIEMGVELPKLYSAKGPMRRYTDSPQQFTLALPFTLNESQVSDIVSDVRANDWIDLSARAVVVELLLFNPAREMYVHVMHTMEISESGRTVLLPQVRPFWMFMFDSQRLTFVFATDILSAVYAVWVVKDVVWHVRVNVRTGLELIGVWELIAIAHCAVLCVFLVQRYTLWGRGGVGTALEASRLYTELTEYEGWFNRSRDFGIAALLLAWVRILEFLRYNKRLNSVSETIRLGADDLISLCVIMGFVLIGFGLAGNGLYGWHREEFATLGESVSWLVRAMISSDMSVWSQLAELEPVWTPVFVLLFFLLSWLVLLNIVLGILAQGFSIASQAEDEWSWGFKSLRNDLLNLLAEIRSSCSESAAEPDRRARAKSTAGSAPASDSALSPTDGGGRNECCSGCLSCLGEGRFVERRVGCIKALMEVIRSKEKEFNETEDQRIEAGVKESWQRRVFHKAEVHLSYIEVVQAEGWQLGKHDSAACFRAAKRLAGESFSDAEQARRRHQNAVVEAVDKLSRRMRRQLVATGRDIETGILIRMEEALKESNVRFAQDLSVHADRIMELESVTQVLLRDARGELEQRVQSVDGSLQRTGQEVLSAVHGLGTQTRERLAETVEEQRREVVSARDHVASKVDEHRKASEDRLLGVLTDGEGRVRGDIAAISETLEGMDGSATPMSPSVAASAPAHSLSAESMRQIAAMDLRERALVRRERELRRRGEELEDGLKRLQRREASLESQISEAAAIRVALRRRDTALSRRAEALDSREYMLGTPGSAAGSPRRAPSHEPFAGDMVEWTAFEVDSSGGSPVGCRPAPPGSPASRPGRQSPVPGLLPPPTL